MKSLHLQIVGSKMHTHTRLRSGQSSVILIMFVCIIGLLVVGQAFYISRSIQLDQATHLSGEQIDVAKDKERILKDRLATLNVDFANLQDENLALKEELTLIQSVLKERKHIPLDRDPKAKAEIAEFKLNNQLLQTELKSFIKQCEKREIQYAELEAELKSTKQELLKLKQERSSSE